MDAIVYYILEMDIEIWSDFACVQFTGLLFEFIGVYLRGLSGK